MNVRVNWLLISSAAVGLALVPLAGQGQDRKPDEKDVPRKVDIKSEAPTKETFGVVPWPYQAKRRQAGEKEIAQWIKDLGDNTYKTRESASKALVEVGAPALKGLVEAAGSGDVEVRQRARMLIDRIETYEALAPTVINGKFDDVSLPQVVAVMAKQSKIKLDLIPAQGPGRVQLDQRKIKLELNNVPFWEAVDRLCETANLVYAQAGQMTLQLQLAEGGQVVRPPSAYTGPFRMRITGMNYYRNLSLLGPQLGGPGQTMRTESLSVNMDILSEPQIAMIAMGGLQITEALDENGQSLVGTTATGGYPVNYGGNPTAMQLRQASFNLRPANKPSATLQVLRGTLPVEVLTQRKPLIAIDDIFNGKARLVKGDGELVLALLQVQDNGQQRNGNIRFFMTGLGEKIDLNNPYPWQEMFRQRFDLTDAQGRRYHVQVNMNFTGNTDRDRAIEGNIYFNAAQDVGPAARLTFNSHKTIRTSVPFEFRNVPMP